MTISEVGFIFDMDGVLADTVEHHYRSWKSLSAELGLPFDRADNDDLRGRSRRDALTLFLKGRRFSADVTNKLMKRKNELFLESISKLRPEDLLPGVASLLAEARAAGICLGVASASRNVRTVCERLGIIGLFDAVGDGYCVANTKPAPDIFLWVAGRMNLNPCACVVFEDSEAGIEAARSGGFHTVGLGPPSRVGRAHQIRRDLRGASVGEFIPSRLGGRAA